MAARYRHYRTRGIYEVVGEGFHTETEEPLVIYKSMDDGRIWCRPKEMFFGVVETEDGVIERFEKVEE